MNCPIGTEVYPLAKRWQLRMSRYGFQELLNLPCHSGPNFGYFRPVGRFAINIADKLWQVAVA
jgi:hypothetical protein